MNEKEIIRELLSKHKGDNVGFILACENYRSDNELYQKIINSDEYKIARNNVKSGTS